MVRLQDKYGYKNRQGIYVDAGITRVYPVCVYMSELYLMLNISIANSILSQKFHGLMPTVHSDRLKIVLDLVRKLEESKLSQSPQSAAAAATSMPLVTKYTSTTPTRPTHIRTEIVAPTIAGASAKADDAVPVITTKADDATPHYRPPITHKRLTSLTLPIPLELSSSSSSSSLISLATPPSSALFKRPQTTTVTRNDTSTNGFDDDPEFVQFRNEQEQKLVGFQEQRRKAMEEFQRIDKAEKEAANRVQKRLDIMKRRIMLNREEAALNAQEPVDSIIL